MAVRGIVSLVFLLTQITLPWQIYFHVGWMTLVSFGVAAALITLVQPKPARTVPVLAATAAGIYYWVCPGTCGGDSRIRFRDGVDHPIEFSHASGRLAVECHKEQLGSVEWWCAEGCGAKGQRKVWSLAAHAP